MLYTQFNDIDNSTTVNEFIHEWTYIWISIIIQQLIKFDSYNLVFKLNLESWRFKYISKFYSVFYFYNFKYNSLVLFIFGIFFSIMSFRIFVKSYFKCKRNFMKNIYIFEDLDMFLYLELFSIRFQHLFFF